MSKAYRSISPDRHRALLFTPLFHGLAALRTGRPLTGGPLSTAPGVQQVRDQLGPELRYLFFDGVFDFGERCLRSGTLPVGELAHRVLDHFLTLCHYWIVSHPHSPNVDID
jgi:hypothetical protein